MVTRNAEIVTHETFNCMNMKSRAGLMQLGHSIQVEIIRAQSPKRESDKYSFIIRMVRKKLSTSATY